MSITEMIEARVLPDGKWIAFSSKTSHADAAIAVAKAESDRLSYEKTEFDVYTKYVGKPLVYTHKVTKQIKYSVVSDRGD